MNRLYSVLIGLLAASVVLFGVLHAAGTVVLQPVYLLCYALAAAVVLTPGGRGKAGRVTKLAVLFLIFALVPYGWEQSASLREGVDRYTSAVLGVVLGWVLFRQRKGE